MKTNVEFRILRKMRSGYILVRECWATGYQDLTFSSTAALLEYAGAAITNE